MSGCSSGQQTTDHINIIDYAKIDQHVLSPSEKIMDRSHCISLKIKNKHSAVKSFDKVVVFDQKLYVLDTYTRKLVVFDWEGNPLRTLDRKGRGPGEYLSIEDFCIDACGHLYIIDPRTSKVIEYDADFNAIGSWHLPYVSNQIAALPDGHFLLNLLPVNKGKYSDMELLVVDSAFQNSKCILKYDAPVSLDEVISLPRITCSKYGTCYHRSVNDNTYILRPNGDLETVVSFDFGSLSVPGKHRKNLEQNLRFYKDYVTLEECYAVADGKIYGVLFDHAEEYLFVLDRSTNRLLKKHFDNTTGGFGESELPIGVSGDYFITSVPSASNEDDSLTDDYPFLCLYEI